MNDTIAIINLKNLQYNYNSIRRKTKSKVMAVVKADAYGHGMIECAKALKRIRNSPEYFGVALLKEAIELRNSNIINEPILCFAPFNEADINLYQKFKIIPTLVSVRNLKIFSQLNLRSPFKVHININTGMNRLGIKFDEAVRFVKKVQNNKNLIIDGIYTHFATSDEKDKKFANLQLNRFLSVINEIKNANINVGTVHAANSGAILDMTGSYFDMVRPGISLYGYYPSQETSESIKLKPVMSLVSKISTISQLQKNETVGYGRKFRSKSDTKIGTLPIGYADGVLRGLSNNIKVIIGNKLYSQIGRVSMDRISINLENDKIKLGSKTILLGANKKNKIDAWDWSNILNMIPYEITCSISKRVERKYIT